MSISILKSLLASIVTKEKPRADAKPDGPVLQAKPYSPSPRNEPTDRRHAIYGDLHQHQLVEQERENRHSADLILSRLFSIYRPKSVLDVGCGIGSWLAAARALGIDDVFGIDGHWLDKRLAQVSEHVLRTLDLELKFDLGRRFDLVICLEVAEHLSPAAARGFVESLTAHSDVVLFSAAIPFQGGHHHVNEQFPDYWCAIFESLGYAVVDCLRAGIWNDDSVLWWLRQNIMVYAKAELTVGNGPFAQYTGSGPLCVVHPGLYLTRANEALAAIQDSQRLLELIAAGKPVSVQRRPDGTMHFLEN